MNKALAFFVTVAALVIVIGSVTAVHNKRMTAYRDMESLPAPDLYDRAQDAMIGFGLVPPACGTFEARRKLLSAFQSIKPSWLTKVPNVLNPRPEKYDFPAKMYDCAAELTLALSPEEAGRFDAYVNGDEFAVAEFPLFKSIQGLAAALTKDEETAADYLMHDKIKKKEIQIVTESGRPLLAAKIHYSVTAEGRGVRADFIAAELRAYRKLLDKIH